MHIACGVDYQLRLHEIKQSGIEMTGETEMNTASSSVEERFERVGAGGRHSLYGTQENVDKRIAQLKLEYPGPYQGHKEGQVVHGDGNVTATFRWFSCE